MESKACVVCDTSSNLKVCSGCNAIVYCSRKCQNLDWGHNDHKLICDIIQRFSPIGAPGDKRKRERGNEDGGKKARIGGRKYILELLTKGLEINTTYQNERIEIRNTLLGMSAGDILPLLEENDENALFYNYLALNEEFLYFWLIDHGYEVDREPYGGDDYYRAVFIRSITQNIDELIEEGAVDESLFNSMSIYFDNAIRRTFLKKPYDFFKNLPLAVKIGMVSTLALAAMSGYYFFNKLIGYEIDVSAIRSLQWAFSNALDALQKAYDAKESRESVLSLYETLEKAYSLGSRYLDATVMDPIIKEWGEKVMSYN